MLYKYSDTLSITYNKCNTSFYQNKTSKNNYIKKIFKKLYPVLNLFNCLYNVKKLGILIRVLIVL